MARIKYSPIVSEVSGSVGDATFAKWKGQSYIRARVTPSNPKTAAQTAVREAMKETVALWQALTDDMQGYFGAGVSGESLSGYNSFVKRNRTAIQQDEGLTGPKRPPGTDPTLILVPDDAAAATGTAAGEIEITWTDPGGGSDDYLGVIAYDETDDELIECDVDAVQADAETYTITDCGDGHDVTIALIGYNDDLDVARHAASLTATAGA